MREPDGIAWRRSSYTANGSACVEVATSEARVLVRDSKDPSGPVLTVSAGQWRSFLVGLELGAVVPA